MTVILTPRLRLDALEAKHAPLFFDGLQDKALYTFIDDTPPISVEALAARYEILSRTWSPDGKERWLNWAVFQLKDSVYIGYVQATVQSSEQCSIAYVLFTKYWGKGFASEAVQAMLTHLADAFGVRKVTACTEIENLASRALLSRLGFEETASSKFSVESTERIYQKWIVPLRN
ncbi:GNAT family N-acetyltransferase [Burkholderia pseudomallei]|uniref:GNAT family N-acetyltransferase n=1 Tax=Burkholderia pseudomallei TaxID=28450 RepID=UPI0003D90CC7|nr:GNAT family N-acetyltransferase [Burkholderia pseudomallei]AHE31010.1 FR47-like family protein [Burkholderia pseudomallei NCTC 13178]KGC47405.1 FR47-like family protein [Burkholderia pseudomallei]